MGTRIFVVGNAFRSGFMHYFHKKEFLVKMWDKTTEDISKDELVDETIQRLKDNLFNLDQQLAPYPYDIWPKWKLLTSQISGLYCVVSANFSS